MNGDEIADVITRLHNRGVTLTPEGDGLHARPRSAVTKDEADFIRANKSAIIAALTYSPPVSDGPRSPNIAPDGVAQSPPSPESDLAGRTYIKLGIVQNQLD